MVKSISLKKNERKKYNKLVGIIAVVFLVCFASRLFVPAVSSEQSTQIGKIIKQDTREYQLIDRAYFPKNKRLDVLFFSPINSSNVLDELSVTVKKIVQTRHVTTPNYKKLRKSFTSWKLTILKKNGKICRLLFIQKDTVRIP